MTLIDEYLDEAEKYRIKYGDNTAVLTRWDIFTKHTQ